MCIRDSPCSPKETRYGTLRRCGPAHGGVKAQRVPCSGYPVSYTHLDVYKRQPLTPEEQEELRKKEERKDRLHQNYLRRKANGKQKEWEERYNAKRKAQVEAAKAAIRAEDMEKGIFTTISQLPRQEPRKATVPASAAV